MRVAAIDLGSNSFHLIVAESKKDEGFYTIDSSKEMIKIGKDIETRELSEDAVSKAIECLNRFVKIAQSHGVAPENIIACATSAIRESTKKLYFIKKVKKEIDINVRVISGSEEAKLIYMAVRQAIDISNRAALIIDVGGGSVEFIVGNADNMIYAASKRIGIIRLGNYFLSSDPMSTMDIFSLNKHLDIELHKLKCDMISYPYDFAIGSSGTILSISKMISEGKSPNSFSSNLNGCSVSYKEICLLYDQIIKMNAIERRKVKGLDEKRQKLIPIGLILYKKIFEVFSLTNIITSDSALREGIVIDHLSRHSKYFRSMNVHKDPASHSVLKCANRFQCNQKHQEHVAKLALSLFDQFKTIHNLDNHAKVLLEYSAILHRVGLFMSRQSFHKHSFYIIKNVQLHGLSPYEKKIIAFTCRYHRKSLPKASHKDFHNLSGKEKKIICTLASLVRIASALDRTERQVVKKLSIKIGNESKISISIVSELDCEVETWAANKAKFMFEEIFRKKISFI